MRGENGIRDPRSEQLHCGMCADVTTRPRCCPDLFMSLISCHSDSCPCQLASPRFIRDHHRPILAPEFRGSWLRRGVAPDTASRTRRTVALSGGAARSPAGQLDAFARQQNVTRNEDVPMRPMRPMFGSALPTELQSSAAMQGVQRAGLVGDGRVYPRPASLPPVPSHPLYPSCVLHTPQGGGRSQTSLAWSRAASHTFVLIETRAVGPSGRPADRPR